MSQPHSHKARKGERGLGDRHGEIQVTEWSTAVQITFPSPDVKRLHDPEPVTLAVGSDDHGRLPHNFAMGDDATGDFQDQNISHRDAIFYVMPDQ